MTPGSPPSPATTTPACTPRSSRPSSRPTPAGRRPTATTPGRRPWTSASARSSGRRLEAFPVFNGTGGNVTALSARCCAPGRPSSAPRRRTSTSTSAARRSASPAPSWSMFRRRTASSRRSSCADGVTGFGDQHHVQAAVVSISQSTELGTVYTPDEIGALAGRAHDAGLLLHVDGARLVNAADALDAGAPRSRHRLRRGRADLRRHQERLAGRRGGRVPATPGSPRATLYARKQGTQLASKMRFVSAQLLRLLKDDLWRETAGHANAMARRLGARPPRCRACAGLPGAGQRRVRGAPPATATERLLERYRFYVWDEQSGVVR